MSQSSQKPKRKRKLPKNITERSDREIMEKLFGKRAACEMERAAHTDEPDEKEDS